MANIYIDAVTKNNEAADVMAHHFSEAWCDVLLGRDYETQRKYTQAEALDSQALEVQRRVSGPERSNTLSTMTSLGLMYYREAKYAQAEALLKQVLEIQRRVLGLEHPSTVRSLTNLVIDYQAQGNYPAANALARTALASSPSNPRFLGNVAWILVAAADPGQRRPAEALPLARRAIQAEPDNADFYQLLGLVEYRNDHWDAAISSLNRSVIWTKARSLWTFSCWPWRIGVAETRARRDSFSRAALKRRARRRRSIRSHGCSGPRPPGCWVRRVRRLRRAVCPRGSPHTKA